MIRSFPFKLAGYQTPPINPCDRCGAMGHLSVLPAQFFGTGIQQSALLYIHCEACSHRITSDDVLGADPVFSNLRKMTEVVSVWNQLEYVPQLCGETNVAGVGETLAAVGKGR
jgi:hypothetical protein